MRNCVIRGFLATMRALRHDKEAAAARASVSRSIRPVIGYPQCSVRTRAACRFSSCASIRPANVSKRFSAAGFSFARYGGSCPRWVVRAAFARPDEVQVQLAELPDGAAFLCFARGVTRPPRAGVIQHPPMSWQWGATSLMQASWSMPMVANSTVPASPLVCRVGCAIDRIAAARRSRRCNIG